ncbi:MAG TPA: Tat pathway signal sequence domain protein, partial [Streptosporangiaceae bacterium]
MSGVAAGALSAGPAQAASPAEPGPAASGPAATPARDASAPGGVRPFPLRNQMRTDRAWEDFLAGQDLVWKRMPRTWYEGPFLGNGHLACGVYKEPGANALRIKVDHGEVQDHRPAFGNEWGVARLPVGHLTLEPVGTITAVDLRLDLWNAELRGTITTDRGRLTLRALVQNDRTMLLATVTPSPGERDFRWAFHPAEAVSPRIIREPPPAGFDPNPPPSGRTEGGVQVVVQPLVAGGQTVTAYREKTTDHGCGERTLYLAVAHSFPDLSAEARALSTVRRAYLLPPSMLVRAHRDWWRRFYRKSFVSVPDALLQSFYWIQLYKLASASREHSPVMATTGPWLEPTPWPGVWWNLNVQLEYWPVYGSNHLELDAIPRTLSEHRQILVDALRPEYRGDSAGLRRSTDGQMDDAGYVGAPGIDSPAPEVGDLPWALHNVWLHYRHSMDLGVLRDVVFPLLRRAMNYYLHFLYTGADGRLHLPYTFSPEYGTAPDCNYDLALIRWSCQTLLDAAGLLGIDDLLAPRWREVLEKLAPYPVDGNGFMVGAGVAFAKSHRHYSHLLMVYPLCLVNGEQAENRELIERSLRHWISFEGALRGYSFTGAA